MAKKVPSVRDSVKSLLKITINDMRAMTTAELKFVSESIVIILSAINSELSRRELILPESPVKHEGGIRAQFDPNRKTN